MPEPNSHSLLDLFIHFRDMGLSGDAAMRRASAARVEYQLQQSGQAQIPMARPAVDDSIISRNYTTRPERPAADETHYYSGQPYTTPPVVKGRSPTTDLITAVAGQKYKVTLNNPGKGLPLDIAWLGNLSPEMQRLYKDMVPEVPYDKLVKILKKKGVAFTPMSNEASSADYRKLLRAGQPGQPKTAELREQFQQKRIQMFERLLDGKATKYAPGKWKIGPILALMAAMGLVGTKLWDQLKGEHDRES